jgi:hypothetical protein
MCLKCPFVSRKVRWRGTLLSLGVLHHSSHFTVGIVEAEGGVVGGKDGECSVRETSPDGFLV